MAPQPPDHDHGEKHDERTWMPIAGLTRAQNLDLLLGMVSAHRHAAADLSVLT